MLQTTRMVRLDWRRSVQSPGAAPCLRRTLSAGIGKKARVVSFRRISFPKLAPYTAAFRGVVSVPVKGTRAKVEIEAVPVGKGRTEISLTSIAPAAAGRVVDAADARLARVLVGRALHRA